MLAANIMIVAVLALSATSTSAEEVRRLEVIPAMECL